ncbi:histone-fold-containing protein [Catenaria anguillulae PL171]|uniref:Histone-fold-containing protein n=1 Tax=Catenaria anguillulae PL171 TaxID=765915 RepID=A0A1Y2I270_9FUNG|nr:histone-fold-containing protein [Catenaria anguillulae PL171]
MSSPSTVFSASSQSPPQHTPAAAASAAAATVAVPETPSAGGPLSKKFKPRFPTARIKKIMQSDEDVGKLNQATPILVSKALELFMQSLLTAAIAQAQAGDAPSRKLLPLHMKAAIDAEDKFDFLRDLADTAGAKKGRGSGRAKKNESAEDGSD